MGVKEYKYLYPYEYPVFCKTTIPINGIKLTIKIAKERMYFFLNKKIKKYI